MTQKATRLRGWRIMIWSSAILACALTPEISMAQGQTAIVVHQDPGGSLGERRRLIKQLQSTGQRMELRGICYSACTMYLGLPNACVAPSASFGFHGPSSHGIALPPQEFERWSQVMAHYYREPLRSWYLSTARYEINGHYRLSGAELIRMGYARC